MTSFEEYIDQYGCHFNEKLYKFAVSMMRDRNGNKIPPMTKEQAVEWLRIRGVNVKNGKGHDVPYVLAMNRADCMGSSVTDEAHLALSVRDFLDDIDGSETKAFDHFVVDCRAKDIPIFWDEML